MRAQGSLRILKEDFNWRSPQISKDIKTKTQPSGRPPTGEGDSLNISNTVSCNKQPWVHRHEALTCVPLQHQRKGTHSQKKKNPSHNDNNIYKETQTWNVKRWVMERQIRTANGKKPHPRGGVWSPSCHSRTGIAIGQESDRWLPETRSEERGWQQKGVRDFGGAMKLSVLFCTLMVVIVIQLYVFIKTRTEY